MIKFIFVKTFCWWCSKRIEKWEAERARRKYLSEIDYCDGRIDSYKDILCVLKRMI